MLQMLIHVKYLNNSSLMSGFLFNRVCRIGMLVYFHHRISLFPLLSELLCIEIRKKKKYIPVAEGYQNLQWYLEAQKN